MVPVEPPGALEFAAHSGVSAETRGPAEADSDSPDCARPGLEGTAEWMPALDTIAGRLAASQDAEHLLAAAVMTLDSDPARGFELLAHAWTANPGHPLVALNRLDACMAHRGLEACTDHDVEAEAIRIEGSNGALWARIAAKRQDDGDVAGAMRALQRAATAPRYDVYWIDHIKLFERALAASTDLSYRERAVAAMGITAAMWRPEYELVPTCVAGIATSPEWRPACGEFGRRLEEDGGTLLDTVLGVAIQAAVYEADGDTRMLAIASRKRDALRATLRQDAFQAAQRLLVQDERLLTDYLEEIDAYGEVAALQFLESEVARLQALPGYDPCR